jgi:hypothetical protein
MPSAFDAEIEQLTRETQALVDAWSELLLLPLAWLGAAGGAATRYRSDEFSVPPLSLDRALVPGPLTIGIPRAGYPPEQIPTGALQVVPSVLPAGHTGFHLVVDAKRLAGAPGGTYWGEVTCGDSSQSSGNGVAVPVWLVIP